jgi:hypothetical protein
MAWRPYENLIEGELDNRTPGIVTGWIRFARFGKAPLRVSLDLAGDFHEDIRGKVIRFSNPTTLHGDVSLVTDNLEGFSTVQCGQVGDVTAGLALGPWSPEVVQRLMAQHELKWDQMGLGATERSERRQEFAADYDAHVAAGELFYAYVPYPYIEWYSQRNGRVVLELDASQLEIVEEGTSLAQKSPKELLQDEARRKAALGAFMEGMVEELSDENRKQGGDGNVFGAVIG